MEQQASPLAATLLRHARRALLLVGAVFVWWLVFLAGGAAHADDTGTVGSTDQVRPTAHVVGLVDAGTTVATTSLRTVPSHVTHTLAAVTGHAPAPVVPTLQKLATELEPRLSFTTDRVADGVDATVARTDAVLAPELAPTAHPTTSSRVSPSTHAQRLLRAMHIPAARYVISADISQAAVQSNSSTVDTAPADPRGDGPVPGSPDTPGAPGLPGGGSSAGGAGSAASLAGLFVMLPGVRRVRVAHDAARVLGGPAFPPGSSPD